MTRSARQRVIRWQPRPLDMSFLLRVMEFRLNRCSRAVTEETKMMNRLLAPWTVTVSMLVLIACAITAIDSGATSRKQPPPALTGRFVAQVDGPSVTGFGWNQQTYIFQQFSPFGTQFVAVSDTFLIYQPHLPSVGLDYSKFYKLTAARNEKCDDTLENISRRFIFDSHGRFVEMKYALTYTKNFPSLTLPWQTPLPCYVVSPVRPGAAVITEAAPETTP